MRVRTLGIVAPVLVAVLAASACGGGSNESGGATTATTSGNTSGSGGGTTLQLAADPNGALKFDKTTLEAPAGNVTIDFTNDSSTPHDVTIEGNGVDAATKIFSGGEESVTADLPAGTYTFFCSVPGHEDAGMKGTLTVK